MTTLNFKINEKNYSVDCGVGQETQILSIVKMIDEKAKSLAKMFGEVDSETLLLMVCILVFGELEKAKNKLSSLEMDIKSMKQDDIDINGLNNIIIDLAKKVKSISSSIKNETTLNP
ncbi:cell division protein ZapA [bacterium]|nr:cell division protein ZapA [bacterium]